ncbi:hypothetical protein [Leucobacter chinensis]|uniref:hypothetical protein n=1 Tax=Leucobacter chinensis TaxID=2851010 RepID=UPI001C234BA8|nr:hypothetical protein [Leucobacter chinensis]
MNDPLNSRAPHLGVSADELNGYTVEQLSDYLDAGRTPDDPEIEHSPGCLLVLDALERLRDLTPELLEVDAAAEAEPEESFVQSILSSIALDARAGRRIPIEAEDPTFDLGITEGALRGVIRSAESAVPGALVGKCRFDGDLTTPGAPVRVQAEVSIRYGLPIPELVEQLRSEIQNRIRVHSTIRLVAVDLTVRDVHERPAMNGDQR